MKRNFSRTCLALSIALMLSMASMAQAKWYNPLSWFKKKPKRIETLIVTGNYVRSRLLAELIQYETKQPVLLLPSGKEDDTMFILGPNMQAVRIKSEDYRKYVNIMQPKKVLFLGNDNYTEPKYVDMLKNQVATWVINNDDWQQIAESTGEMLRLKKLKLDYMVLINQLDDQGQIRSLPEDQLVPGKGNVFEGFKIRGVPDPEKSAKKDK